MFKRLGKERFSIDPAVVEKGRNSIFKYLMIGVLIVTTIVFTLIFGAGRSTSIGDECSPPAPWISIENQRVTLEDGSSAYLRCGWVGDIKACPLPLNIPVWNERTQAKWDEVRQHCGLIVETAEEYRLDPLVLASVMMQESGGWSGAESSAGAMGLMQVMPFHACSSWNPVENVRCGASILADHLTDDSLREGFAAYNAGVNGRDTYGRGYDFADIVLAIHAQVKAASQLVNK
jgi:hypothetical protein